MDCGRHRYSTNGKACYSGVLELEDKHNVGAAESSYRKVVLNATSTYRR